MTHGSLFSGIGGFDLAAERQGFKNVFACEIDVNCQKVLKKNFPNINLYADIKELHKEKKLRADIISAGFPCQDISSANSSGKGLEGKRSGLFFEVIKIVRLQKPKFVILENVANLFHKGFETVISEIAALGYNAEWRTLQSDWFGFPHKRKRVLIVAYNSKLRFNENTIFKEEYIQHFFKKEKRQPENKVVGLLCNFHRNFNQEINRYGSDGDYGVSEKLDFTKWNQQQIKMLGNSIQLQIAEYIFYCIKQLRLN